MTVYVVQDTKWIDPADGRMKSKFDFSPAEKFGNIEYLLDPSDSPFSLEDPLRQLKFKLVRYDPSRDYILTVGNPVLIGLAIAIAADYGDGDVSLLQWSGSKRYYIPVHAQDIFPEEDPLDRLVL